VPEPQGSSQELYGSGFLLKLKELLGELEFSGIPQTSKYSKQFWDNIQQIYDVSVFSLLKIAYILSKKDHYMKSTYFTEYANTIYSVEPE
jgi:hypothetical protein